MFPLPTIIWIRSQFIQVWYYPAKGQSRSNKNEESNGKYMSSTPGLRWLALPNTLHWLTKGHHQSGGSSTAQGGPAGHAPQQNQATTLVVSSQDSDALLVRLGASPRVCIVIAVGQGRDGKRPGGTKIMSRTNCPSIIIIYLQELQIPSPMLALQAVPPRPQKSFSLKRTLYRNINDTVFTE